MELRKSAERLPGRAVALILLLLCVSGMRTETALYSVPEEVERGSFVANIAKDLGLTGEELSARQARLVPEGEKQYLQLNQHTGDLVVREQMDREELCGQTEPCLVRFEVLLESPLQSFRAEVSLTDINDHAPVFLNKEIVLKIPESAMPEARFLLESAQDPDVGNNSLQHYNISSNDYFHICTRRRSDGRRYAELVLDRALDREQQAEVAFSVTAVDGGSPPRSGTALIRVVVLDTNDNIPAFSRSLYKVRVLENSAEDTPVVVVSASDLDSGTNGEIAYSIVQNSEENLQTFKINPETGQIGLKKTVDYEETKTYEIDVQATDGGGLFAHCKVEVQVEDVNDNAPEVIITSLTSTLSEAAPPNTVVALFNVRDRDSGDNGRTSCELPGEQPFSITPLAADAYALVTSEALDREEVAEYNVTVRARDEGSPALSASKTLLVRLLDVNDNAPTFAQAVYTMVLSENEPAGTSLGRLSATDADAGKNARVRYALEPPPPGAPAAASFVSVDTESGTVRALRPLDYEEVRAFEVAVRATDGAALGEREGARPPPRRRAAGRRFPRRIRETEAVRRPDMAIARQVLCLSAFLSLPHARAEPMRYSVAEEAESGSVVANVAEDAGLAPAQLSARRARLASEDGRQHFRLDRGTGRLVVAERLDREELCGQAGTCTLPFELLLANPLQFFRVEVAVEDINDHSPVFPEERVTFTIPETSNPGSRFPLEGARDLDVGSNSIQAYSIAPENEYFAVSFGSRSEDDKYIELVLEKALDREEQAELAFSLIAVDGGSPPRSGTTQIRIVVLDVNDNAPVFTQKVYVGQVLENAPEGSVVLSVVASDRDVGANGDIAYQFSQAVGQSPSAFAIDPTSGEIKLTKPLDFEAAENHELSVRATDGGGLSAICKVLVEVVDVNDNAPELVVSSFSSPLPENALPGTVVALFTVRDRDAGANGKISCALEDQLLFSLRPAYKNYYELVTVSALDREETAAHKLILTATDSGSPVKSGSTTIQIIVLDGNDNAPEFTQPVYKVTVREDVAVGSRVLQVTATDRDEGPNAEVKYSFFKIPEKFDKTFKLDPGSGEIEITEKLNFEEQEFYELDVQARDAGGLSSHSKVLITVADVNNHVPEIVIMSVFSPVPEDTPLGTVIAIFNVQDRDSGANGE
ncbi:PREDICTED: protocadherin beta-15-like, partial [Aptenodytes forsteri]